MTDVAIDITPGKEKQEYLFEAKKKAESASLAKIEFIANISHEVKKPISGMIVLYEILTLTLKDNDDLSLAQGIRTAGQRLLEFFENCLELSKSEISESTFLS